MIMILPLFVHRRLDISIVFGRRLMPGTSSVGIDDYLIPCINRSKANSAETAMLSISVNEKWSAQCTGITEIVWNDFKVKTRAQSRISYKVNRSMVLTIQKPIPTLAICVGTRLHVPTFRHYATLILFLNLCPQAQITAQKHQTTPPASTSSPPFLAPPMPIYPLFPPPSKSSTPPYPTYRPSQASP